MLAAPGNQSHPAGVKTSVNLASGLEGMVQAQPSTRSSITHRVKLLSELQPCPGSGEREAGWDCRLR